MRSRRLGRLVFALTTIAVVMILGNGDKVYGTAEETAGLITYGGTVIDKPNEFVAVGLSGGNATIYICDGQPDKGTVTIAEWFFGPVKDNRIDITSVRGHRVQVAIAETTAEGQFTFKDGTIKKFSLKLLEGRAGLYRSEFVFGDDKVVAGWLIIPDKSAPNGFAVRGASVETSATGTVKFLVPASFNFFGQGLDESRK
jgi:hypothetical protein